jgi:hypothetical protein
LASTITSSLLAVKLVKEGIKFPCIMSVSDSSFTVGWLHKASFYTSEPLHDKVARWYAEFMAPLGAVDYSQHIKGIINIVADSFSRDFHLTEPQILAILRSDHPSLVPQSLSLQEIPPHLSSLIVSLVQKSPRPTDWKGPPKTSTAVRGLAGWSSASDARSPIPIWLEQSPHKKCRSLAITCMQSVAGHSAKYEELLLKALRLERPSIIWRRPSQQVVNPTQQKCPKEPLGPKSPDKRKDTRNLLKSIRVLVDNSLD